MRRINTLFILFVSALVLSYVLYTRCGGNGIVEPSSKSADGEIPMRVSSYDTTAVLSLAKEYLNYVVDSNYDAALDMLYVLDEYNLPVELDSAQRQYHRKAMALYPMSGYEIERLTFWRATDSRLDYYILISNPSDRTEKARVRSALRPVRYEDIWYLTIADDRGINYNSEISQ